LVRETGRIVIELTDVRNRDEQILGFSFSIFELNFGPILFELPIEHLNAGVKYRVEIQIWSSREKSGFNTNNSI
jgi:hypothetical protein